MLRRDLLRAGAAIGMGGIAGCTSQRDSSDFTEGFEDGFNDWESNATIGPEVDIAEFEWDVTVSNTEAAGGDRSLRIWNEGDYDDGVTWVTHPISIKPGHTYHISVSGQFWSESESFNTIR
ncbi:MAG: hypothetical protein ABEH65_12450, partial [Halobacteriales archaeon]